MARPTALAIQGLFGHLNHDIAFGHDEPVTILTGPNGSGKTHALNILRAMVGLDFGSLFSMPFEFAQVSFDSGSRLTAELSADHETLRVKAEDKSHGTLGELSVDRAEMGPPVPEWLEQVDEDRWFDQRESRFLSSAAVLKRYNIDSDKQWSSRLAGVDWLERFRPAAAPILIATGRLDVRVHWEEALRGLRRAPESAARIVQYAERIQSQIVDARRASLMQSQRADRGFAVRALDKARATVKESELRSRYAQISALNQELHTNGLTEEAVDVAIPAGQMNPTERRILNLFLDDWENKLAPLLPIHEKLQLLKDIVGSKFSPKYLSIEEGELRVVSPTGEVINVDLLSSGEQHLLALYTMLLFSASPDSLVLVDEPEISLHASWKHAFLTDIERVSRLNSLQVVLATHSTGIINGRWDLVREIGAPR